jgi:LCP family protein required for cell wall assembly
MGRNASLAERTPPGSAAVPGDRATPSTKPAKRRPAPLWTKLCIVFGAILSLTATGAFAGTQLLARKIEGSVQRGDLLGDAAPKAPPRVDGPFTFLVMGSDSRAGENANPDTPDGNIAASPGERSDTIILVHVPKAMNVAYVISVPRDTFIPIANKDGTPGGKNKINSAFSDGGAPRLVQTLNNFTGLKIDYPIIVDFSAVKEITDLVGGVDVIVDQESYDEYRFMPANSKYPTTPCRVPAGYDNAGAKRNCLTFKKGLLHLDGELALYYVRQRTGLPRGDLDRAKRQQQFLRALLAKAATGDQLTDLGKFNKLVEAVGKSITVDKRMPVNSIAFTLKGLRPSNMVFMTLPIAGDIKTFAGDSLQPNKAQSIELFTAIKNGTMEQYLLKYPTAANDVSHGS